MRPQAAGGFVYPFDTDENIIYLNRIGDTHLHFTVYSAVCQVIDNLAGWRNIRVFSGVGYNKKPADLPGGGIKNNNKTGDKILQV
jgi:hypothetical protein